MIKYRLICKKCDFSFDSWFASSSEYEKLKKKKFLICYKCDSKQIEKTLMAPSFINKNYELRSKKEIKKTQLIKKKIKEYQTFIKNNFEYVGENFAQEARSIHYSDKKKKDKGIYGKASKSELKDLNDEGIETQMLPWPEDTSN